MIRLQRLLQMYNDEELKVLVAAELDILEVLDIVGMDYEEILDILWEHFSEEGKQELQAAIE